MQLLFNVHVENMINMLNAVNINTAVLKSKVTDLLILLINTIISYISVN